MAELIAVLSIFSIIAFGTACPDVDRKRQPSWFDLQPYMTESKKARGRAQQRRRR